VSFDNSRYTFNPWKNFSGVVMEQGRVQLDADWNEWLAEFSRRIQAGTLDLYGHAAYPPTTPWAFLIAATTGTPNTVTIGLGRMYVDGLLAENHGEPKTASWDTALAELSGTPQPPDLTKPNPNPIDFTKQPYLPHAILPTGNGSYLIYLDVWTRELTYLEDPHLVDIAVGVDTTGRLQTVWQVKYLANTSGWTCATPDSQIPYPAQSTGLLTTDVVPNPTAGPCCLTDGTGFTGLENQFYRVEIHQGGKGSDTPDSKTATFKWSRENASVETSVTAITSVLNSVHLKASQLALTSLGRDQVLGFKNGDWIELLDDWSELWGNPGVLAQIDSVTVSPPSITLTSVVDTSISQPATGTPPTFPVDANFMTDPKRHTRIRRWDQSGIVHDVKGNQWCDLSKTGGAIPVPAADTTLVLESGITVQFGAAGANFNVADFWNFAARTADGSVEKLHVAPTRGIHHHYTKLSVVTFSSPTATYPDCRTPVTVSEESNCCCCSYSVGDGVNSVGQYTSIQQAINTLPASGGEVCILPGRYFEYVSIVGLKDVVIRGCGAQTRLASPTMSPGGASKPGKAGSSANSESGLTAILTVIDSSNVELSCFAVEAADNEVGVLLDGLPGDATGIRGFPSNITISDTFLTASTLPALAAINVDLLMCTGNRIAMKDTSGQWAAVYLSGDEIHFEKNWVGLEDAANAATWMPASVVADLQSNFSKAPGGGSSLLANGGIQIAGGSTDVFVLDNEIEGGLRNGINLGSLVLSFQGSSTGQPIQGLLATPPDPASTQFTLQLPSFVQTKQGSAQLVSGGTLQNVLISRNRIRNMGLCGIGPVGFFNLNASIEVITIQSLTISENTISSSLQDALQPIERGGLFALGYGAICIPDVQNLIVRDNTITDFGDKPGARVCGVYVLNGEQVEIGRNQILETRDWTASGRQQSHSQAAQAGIEVTLVTPPPLDPSTGKSSFGEGDNTPLYQPGLPALRVENNVVRVPLGLALDVFGFGPFSIVSNHFSSGGTVQVGGDLNNLGFAGGEFGSRFYASVLTVSILNYGAAIEVDNPATSFKELFNNGSPSELKIADRALSSSSSGAVVFSDNICQLETRASGIQGITSVGIFTLDHLNFANNHCWLDGGATAVLDAFLLAGSLQVTANRLQEIGGSVLVSGLTYGVSNITTHNTSTFCLFALGAPTLSITTPNVMFSTTLCPQRKK
jgi:hypothetical protein